MSRKTRPEAFEHRHPEAAASCERWLFDERPPLTYEAAAARLQEEFGVSLAISSLSEFRSRCLLRRERERRTAGYLREAASMAKATLNAASADPTIYLRSATIQIGALCQQLLGDQDTDAETLEQLQQLVSMMVSGQKEVRAADSLELARDKFELMRAKAEQAEAAKDAVGDAALTPEEKQRKLQQIFGLV